MATAEIDLVRDWANTTVVHPVGLSALVVALVAVALLPRRYGLLPLLTLVTVVPSAQRFVVFSLDLSFIRILVIAALLRALVSGATQNLRLVAPDKIMLAWAAWGIFAYGMLEESFAGVLTRTGWMVEAAGAYCLGRIYIRNTHDAAIAISMLAVLAVPLMLLFLVEWSTGRNLLSVFGGVPDTTLIRQGRMRCQGPFSHPIMAGVFWAALLPWFAILWNRATVPRWATLSAVVASLVIVVTTMSSTPFVAMVLAVLGLAAFQLRHLLRVARWCLLGGLIALHLVMNAPVWHLLARIDLVGGSTGWHRYHLIDQAIRRVDEWWVFGTRATEHWGRGLGDVTNQFVLEGVRGGLLGLALFCAVLVATFMRIGRSMDAARSSREEFVFWATGVALVVHMANFLAVSYFGQVTCLFFVLLGMTVALTAEQPSGVAQARTERVAPSLAFRVLR